MALLSHPIFLLAAALFGAVVGSFLNVCIWRLPREGMSVVSPRRSHCPSCGFAIPWYDNLPILSWLFLGGCCRSCRTPISSRYLLVEALTAMTFVVLAHRYLHGQEPRAGAFFAVTALAAASIVVAFIDQDLQIIPDEITLPGMMAVPAAAVLVPDLHAPAAGLEAMVLAALGDFLARAGRPLPEALRQGAPLLLALPAAGLGAGALALLGHRLYWKAVHPAEPRRLRDSALAGVLGGFAGGAALALTLRPEWTFDARTHSLWAALFGMAAGSGLVLLVGVLGRQVFRKEAMGFGDVKLMGLLGGFAGAAGVLAAFALACLLGSLVGVYRLVRYRSRYLPFGPYLVLGSLVMIVWPELFWGGIGWYMGLFR